MVPGLKDPVRKYLGVAIKVLNIKPKESKRHEVILTAMNCVNLSIIRTAFLLDCDYLISMAQ